MPPAAARALIRLAAGRARHVPLAAFTALTTIGCALWALAFVLTGMLAANAWTTLDSIVGRVLLAIGILTLAASVLRTRRPN